MANKKIYISLTSDMVDRLDKIAGYYGVTRSAYIAMIIGQNVSTTEHVLKSLPDTLANALNTEK